MINSKAFEEFAQRVMESIPPGIRNLQQDVDKNIRAGINSAFAKLNLVTREEFDVQAGVLARTRAKLQTLEAQVAELEAQLRNKQSGIG
ncbi:MAG TPA: accessory factor UbiK family protein, partial [Gammaproteobacteria bacterium]|nr:accessory factor UbiK family protein [Gammaproteobacteria bacterium]